MTTSILPQNETLATTLVPAKRKFFETPMVTLVVGESEKLFHVHLDLLCDASPFFKAAFAGNFKESFEKMMRLPEDRESTFWLFVDWLYSGRFEMLPEYNEYGSPLYDDDDDEYDDGFLHAIRVFVLAEKYQVCKLKKLVIEVLFAEGTKYGVFPANGSIAYLYEHTTHSGLRRLVADWHVRRTKSIWFDQPQHQAFLRQQPDFAIDLNLSFAKRLEMGPKYDPLLGEMPQKYLNEVNKE